MESERSFVEAFVKRSKRARYSEFLAEPRLRARFTERLAHFDDYDPKWRVPIPAAKLSAAAALRELRKRRSLNVVRAISEDRRLDQKDLPLDDALRCVIGSAMGTVLCCVPGSLAFVETEDDRFLLERHIPHEKREYIRFVTGGIDDESHSEQGIFHAVGQAIREGCVIGADADELNALRAWFSLNLDAPRTFGRGNLPLGICWFKTAAAEHIARIWQMVRILERNGIFVKKIRTARPGYVVYEDDWQLVAEPYREGTLSRK